MRAAVYVQTNQGNSPFRETGTSRGKIRKFLTALRAVLVGGILLRAASRPKVFAAKAHAVGTVSYASSAGAQSVTVNGVAVSSHGGQASDAANATKAAADITASTDALVKNLVEACNLAATFTLASVAVGEYVTIGAYRFTAANTSSPRADEFNSSGNDTADATSLAAQINARVGLNEDFYASSSSGVVTLRQRRGTAAGLKLAKSGAGITLSGQLAATATLLVSAARPGVTGNCITLAASGTGATASGARLTSGTEDTWTF